jgi:hypothetical protein
MTTAQSLVEVQAALTAVRLNQSYRLGDRQVTRADYAALVADETRLLNQLARESGNRPTTIGVDFTGMGY